MKFKVLPSTAIFCLLAISIQAQIAARSGSIYGKVSDDQVKPLAGVSITLESDLIPTQKTVTGNSGAFRFANLPPGVYSIIAVLNNYTEVKQEDIRISTGSAVQLEIILKPSLKEEFTVINESPLMDTENTGTSKTLGSEYLESIPTGRDPWTLVEQTPGIDTDRFSVAGSEAGQQTLFASRGGVMLETIWNYDGVNITDQWALGGTPTYFDFGSFGEVQISTAGNNISIPTNGVTINIVTKRGGNQWAGSASYYFAGEGLQSENTPDELKAQGITASNRLDKIQEYGFEIGGPIVKEKLFAWAAYRKNTIRVFSVTNDLNTTKPVHFNLKTNYNWDTSNESSFGYFYDNVPQEGRPSFGASIQAPETLWDQSNSDSVLHGIWTLQHTWITNETLLNVRYGYIGLGFGLVPPGGKEIPMIFLTAIPHLEDTGLFVSPIDRPGHDINVDLNYFKDDLMGSDHEFKFGFEYKTTKAHTFVSYGNGVFILDYYQTNAGGPLTSGSLLAQHDVEAFLNQKRASFYASDTIRHDRLTLNLGLRFDYQSGKNLPSAVQGVPGFEDVVAPFAFPGTELPFTLNDFSPRIGATYDLTNDGKTILRGNYARYYDAFNASYLTQYNPIYTYNGAAYTYSNLNGDRTITPNELTGGPFPYGGLIPGTFDLQAFLGTHFFDENFHNSHSNEFLVGIERQIGRDLSVSFNYTHRSYHDLPLRLPYGISSSDFVPAGEFTASTVLGQFNVPIFTLPFNQDGSIIYKNLEDYDQTYDGIDVSVQKRMSTSFMFSGTLVLQKQKSHYHGGDAAGYFLPNVQLQAASGIPGAQIFPFDPGNIPFLDGQPYAYGSNYSGKTDIFPYSEWQLRLSGVYQFPWEISLGASARYQQGYPYVLVGGFTDTTLAAALGGAGTHLILVEPFGSRRYDNIFLLDLNFQKTFQISHYGRVSFSAGLFNVTNSNAVIKRNRDIRTDTFNDIQENLSPRALRLGVSYSF